MKLYNTAEFSHRDLPIVISSLVIISFLFNLIKYEGKTHFTINQFCIFNF